MLCVKTKFRGRCCFSAACQSIHYLLLSMHVFPTLEARLVCPLLPCPPPFLCILPPPHPPPHRPIPFPLSKHHRQPTFKPPAPPPPRVLSSYMFYIGMGADWFFSAWLPPGASPHFPGACGSLAGPAHRIAYQLLSDHAADGPITHAFGHNPFLARGRPPKFIRVQLYALRPDPSSGRAGVYWKAVCVGSHLPPMSLGCPALTSVGLGVPPPAAGGDGAGTLSGGPCCVLLALLLLLLPAFVAAVAVIVDDVYVVFFSWRSL
jgi:hypothetical protein